MNKIRKIFKYLLMLFMIIIVNFMIIKLVNVDFKYKTSLKFDIMMKNSGVIQLFYKNSQEQWNEINSIKIEYDKLEGYKKIKFDIPSNVESIRIDTGDTENDVKLNNFILCKGNKNINVSNRFDNIDYGDFIQCKDIENLAKLDQGVSFKAIGIDPYIVLDITKADYNYLSKAGDCFNNVFKIILSIVLTLALMFVFIKSAVVIGNFRDIYSSRKLIWKLALNDFKTKYAGSFFGIVWAFVQPVITIVLYWFVFQIGFRSTDVGACPFVLWLMCGLVPWFFYSDAIINATNSLIEYSYLVKKVVFRISVLPIVKTISALFVHLFFVVFVIVVFSAYKYLPSLYTLQVIYYTFAMFVLVLGISYASCAIIIFFKDLGQIINILMQIGMWLTPIMWHYTMLDEHTFKFFKLNPVYYIVEGYRDSLIDKVWFWERINYSLYFWVVTIIVFGIGAIIFKRLKNHFADVL